VAASFAALYFSLFGLFLGPFPPPLAESTAGFTMGAIVVMAGSLVAPRHRVLTAIVLFVLGSVPITILLGFHLPSACVGGLVSIALLAWWFHPRHTARSTRWVAIGASAASLAFIALVYACHVDRLARPEQLPSELTHALGAEASRVGAFYRYDLGGFIDHEWLWRIHAKPEVIALVVAGLDLQPANAVPPRFWRMPPHYWPRSMPPGALAFQSRSFAGDRRGPDGSHYFLLHDQKEGRALVWVKDNF